MSQHIEAVSVNHNMSPYMELMLRSLRARHAASPLDLAVTVFDNASDDEMAARLSRLRTDADPGRAHEGMCSLPARAVHSTMRFSSWACVVA